jgi:hypothetical protein
MNVSGPTHCHVLYLRRSLGLFLITQVNLPNRLYDWAPLVLLAYYLTYFFSIFTDLCLKIVTFVSKLIITIFLRFIKYSICSYDISYSARSPLKKIYSGRWFSLLPRHYLELLSLQCWTPLWQIGDSWRRAMKKSCSLWGTTSWRLNLSDQMSTTRTRLTDN